MLVTVLRWIAAGVGILLLLGAAFNFGLSIAFDAEVWRSRASRLAAWIRLLALTWFNVEVWGRVVWAITHWMK